MTPSEDGSKTVRIVALSRSARSEAKKVICQSFVLETVQIPDDIDLSPDAGELQEIEQGCSQIQRGKPIKVQVIAEQSKRVVELVGVPSLVRDIKPYVKNLLESKRVRIEFFTMDVSRNVWDFLYDHFGTKVKPIEKQLDSFGVTINLTGKPKEIMIEGNTDGLRRCKEELLRLKRTIFQTDEIIFISPDVRYLFASGMDGEKKLKKIEKDQRVVIRNTPFLDLSVSQSHACRNGGVNILLKHGRIENEVVGNREMRSHQSI